MFIPFILVSPVYSITPATSQAEYDAQILAAQQKIASIQSNLNAANAALTTLIQNQTAANQAVTQATTSLQAVKNAITLADQQIATEQQNLLTAQQALASAQAYADLMQTELNTAILAVDQQTLVVNLATINATSASDSLLASQTTLTSLEATLQSAKDALALVQADYDLKLSEQAIAQQNFDQAVAVVNAGWAEVDRTYALYLDAKAIAGNNKLAMDTAQTNYDTQLIPTTTINYVPQHFSISENGSATLTLPSGMYVSSIDFASYGTPNVATFPYTLGNCHASNSLAIVSNLWLNKSSGTIRANNSTFGDPCGGTYKRLAVAFTIAQPTTTYANDPALKVILDQAILDYNTSMVNAQNAYDVYVAAQNISAQNVAVYTDKKAVIDAIKLAVADAQNSLNASLGVTSVSQQAVDSQTAIVATNQTYLSDQQTILANEQAILNSLTSAKDQATINLSDAQNSLAVAQALVAYINSVLSALQAAYPTGLNQAQTDYDTAIANATAITQSLALKKTEVTTLNADLALAQQELANIPPYIPPAPTPTPTPTPVDPTPTPVVTPTPTPTPVVTPTPTPTPVVTPTPIVTSTPNPQPTPEPPVIKPLSITQQAQAQLTERAKVNDTGVLPYTAADVATELQAEQVLTTLTDPAAIAGAVGEQLQAASAFVGELVTNPGAAVSAVADAVAQAGLDMSNDQREKAQEVIIPVIIVSNVVSSLIGRIK